MGRWLVVLLFTALLALPVLGAQFIESPRAEVQSSGIVVVRWVSSPPVSSYVIFGPFDAFLQTRPRRIEGPAPVVASDRHACAVELDGLRPGTRYAFQVGLTEGATETLSPLGEFTTPGTQSAAARAAPVISDSQNPATPDKTCLNWSTRPPLPIPEEPVLRASLTFLALFAVLLFLTFSRP
jgi:hypothetical protein